MIIAQSAQCARDILLAIAGFDGAAQRVGRALPVNPMQLRRGQATRQQAWMVMALRHNQLVINQIFADDIPRIFTTIFGTTNTKAFALAQRVIHQAFVAANFFTINRDDIARLCRQIFLQEIFEFALADKTNAGRVFFIMGN